MGEVIRVRPEILARLVEEARRIPVQECCGLLGGERGVITQVFPAANVLESATAYEIGAEELFRIFREIRVAALEHLGIYHSHPTGEIFPSNRDIARAFYPDVAYFIVSPDRRIRRSVRAFSICDGRAAELAIQEV